MFSPGPADYTTMDCFKLSAAGQYKMNGRPVVGTETRILFKNKLQEELEKPGPAEYRISSEFGGYENPIF